MLTFPAAVARLAPMLLSCRSKAFQDVNGAANAISLSEPELSIIQRKKRISKMYEAIQQLALKAKEICDEREPIRAVAQNSGMHFSDA